ncbi:protein DA1-like [Rosa rugosa]|uniref:protein DA1-like n=1 Tax=Rosa rugosa TaxID=74645 RepID=UPI002B416275|nr:protein DA1-like [Rosa rugosa]XP_062006243.1 protein DA1-like [Rosa rugosa]XP_062006247.1 protein DA1-like [Rosa rugosa]XP_062006248.1 protein DA1-like [Rosa rugosa]XP_062006254.1 protein DA1-like [Rosa rugosa]XP_062006257.1 protein DA1-like [Rosa rugosa]XP_062006264.1 protein DA1-like [Rosa rugosa]XP_062006268.1 protein DA1-like [Rosa rugosa]XP_062006273.1 protein DA1-like [Rosa rugosa]XP_062006278.1 protein DA1-like [Rosa rugosa]
MASSNQRASTSIPLASSWKYDVFLSFRGKETRNNFTGHLYKALKGKRIRVFKDDRELETGSAISEELWTAIEESKFAIIVFSQDYASSEWCLNELVKIFEGMGERETIIPIFYNVDISDVKHQTGTFEEAFNKHENDGIRDTVKVQGWKTTLTTVCGRAGHVLEAYQSETEFIEKVVDKLVCAGCNGRVGDGLNCLGAVWHRACLLTLLCKGCNHPFTDLEIRECGDQQPYHERCYELEYLVCNVCKKSIQDGQVEYKEYPLWRRRYCSSHVNDGTPRCCSCERLKPRGTTYYKLDDGRKLCQECTESIINTDHGHRSIFLEVQNFYKKLNVKVEKIPVRLVGRQVIIDAMKEGNDYSDRQLPVIRAVGLFEKRIQKRIQLASLVCVGM